MQLDIQPRNDYVFTMDEEELNLFLKNPTKTIKRMRQLALEFLTDELPTAMTRARPRISHKVPCPHCKLYFERRGLGIHIYKAHKRLGRPKTKLIPEHTGD